MNNANRIFHLIKRPSVVSFFQVKIISLQIEITAKNEHQNQTIIIDIAILHLRPVYVFDDADDAV